MTTENKGDFAVGEDVQSKIDAAVAAGQTLLDVDIAAALQGAATPSALNPFATIADVPVLTSDELGAIGNSNAPASANPFMTIADGTFWLGTLANLAAVEAAFAAKQGRASVEGDFAAATLTSPGGRHLLFATAATTWIAVLALVSE